VPEDADVGSILQVDDNKTSDLSVVGPPMEEVPSVKPLTVIQESSPVLPEVKTQSDTDATSEHQKICLQPAF